MRRSVSVVVRSSLLLMLFVVLFVWCFVCDCVWPRGDWLAINHECTGLLLAHHEELGIITSTQKKHPTDTTTQDGNGI
jgi:hypothetical protein